MASKLDQRFSGDANELKLFAIMEAAFAGGNVDELLIYPEVKIERLKVQFPMFLAEYICCNIFEIVETVKQMSLVGRNIFGKIFALTHCIWQCRNFV